MWAAHSVDPARRRSRPGGAYISEAWALHGRNGFWVENLKECLIWTELMSKEVSILWVRILLQGTLSLESPGSDCHKARTTKMVRRFLRKQLKDEWCPGEWNRNFYFKWEYGYYKTRSIQEMDLVTTWVPSTV
jgi:hypothetical protein